MKTNLFAGSSNFQMADKCLMSLQNKVNKIQLKGIQLKVPWKLKLST